jgi:hypothetical protein
MGPLSAEVRSVLACFWLQYSLPSSKLPLEATSAQKLMLGRADAHKPKITMHNGKRWLKWCKAHHHWTLEQWKRVLWSDESRFTIWQSD